MALEPKKKVVKKAAKKAVVKKTTNKTVASEKLITAKGKTLKSKVAKTNLELKTKNTKVSEKNETRTKNPDMVSFIPGTLSLRLAEKKKVYEAWYQTHAPVIVRPTAQVFGYIFIVAGVLSMYFTLDDNRSLLQNSSLFASIACVEDNCLASTTTDLAAPIFLQPQVTFLTSPIVTAKTNTPLTIQVTNAKEHALFLFSPKTGKIVSVPNPVIDQDKFLYNLPTAELSADEYVVKVKVLSLDGQTRSTFTGPTFIVPITTVETLNTTSPSSTSSSTTTTTSSSTSVTNISQVEREDDEEVGVEVVESDPVEVDSAAPKVELVTNTEPIVLEEPITETVVASNTPKLVVEEPERPLSLSLTPTDNKNQFRLFIKATFVYDVVEVYAQSELAKTPLFLGVASVAKDGLYYWFDSSSLPVGNYRLIVRGVLNKEVKDTAYLKFVNKISSAEVTTKEIPKTIVLNNKVATGTADLIKTRLNIITDNNNFSALADKSTTTVEEKVSEHKTRASEIMMQNGEKLDKLFANYASAVSTGEESVLRLAEEELGQNIDRLVSDELLKTESGVSYTELHSALATEITRVKSQITYFETLLKERTVEDTTKDSDGDGISDIDEILIYKTNPNDPDTDGDGFSDGIEITTGYNPNNASPEAVISFASPKEGGYVNNEVIKVDNIVPMLNYEADQVKPSVYSEISGKGIPNSFVTLYIFSTPTVVTVKTDAEGNFSYIFTKELEDGEHEVYVAMTDNSGSIVVKSSPLKFVKTAEAYAYVDPVNEALIPTDPVEAYPEFKLLNLVGAIGVLSFGLILLLLGKSVRSKPEELVANI